jgi:hypothetical protein
MYCLSQMGVRGKLVTPKTSVRFAARGKRTRLGAGPPAWQSESREAGKSPACGDFGRRTKACLMITIFAPNLSQRDGTQYAPQVTPCSNCYSCDIWLCCSPSESVSRCADCKFDICPICCPLRHLSSISEDHRHLISQALYQFERGGADCGRGQRSL